MRRALTIVRRAAGCVVVLAAVGAVLVAFVPQGSASSPARPAVTVSSRVTAGVARVEVAAPPLLSSPEPPPADPYADVPVIPIGEIAIPKIGVDRSFAEGVTLTVIDQGPGHWPGTAAPGGFGNVVIAAHRTIHGGPFLRLGELVPGDQIVLRDASGTFVYAVTGTEVVAPDAVSIVEQHPGHTITLFACHPIGSGSHRIVVHGTLVA